MSTAVVRAVAEYQIMTDDDPREIMSHRLTRAVYDGRIVDFQITGVYPGPFGLGLVTFTADIRMPVETAMDHGISLAETTLNEVIHDTDVQVRWLSAVKP